ncbi:MAG TPA: sugar porter family MFS transporter [Acetobacteraceae bacterium]|jgi:SP family galactose:H+ symporter-like MFS transporter|nr:sugar porter family MFS transporter [Acetobacteraceae bacterium]
MYFYVIAGVAALGGLLFGYDTGVISGALLFIRQVMSLSPTLQGIVVAIALAGATIGAAVAGYLSDRMGRRRIILGAGLLFIAGAIISAFAQGVPVLLIGRFLVGLAIGTASMLTPLYLAEIAPANDRGAIVSLNQLCITAGILVSYLVGYALAHMSDGWRWMLALGAVPGVVLSLGMLVLPESPRWLAGHGRGGDAEKVLRRVRGTADVSSELGSLRTDIAREGGRLASATDLLAPRLRRVLVIGIGLAMFQQITGINTVIYFAPTIFQSAGLSSAATSILATAGVGAVNVIMTIVSMWLIDSLGRRQLLLWSLGGMAVTLFVLSAAFFAGTSGQLAWIAVASVAAYVGFFAIGLGPVFWLLIAEIFPLALRGRAMSLATVANWGFNLIVSATFLNMVGAVGSAGAFVAYGVMSLVAFAFVAWMVPETKGRSLEQIEAALHTGRTMVQAPQARTL